MTSTPHRSPPSPESPETTAELARIGEILSLRVDDLIDRVTAAIHHDIDYYATAEVVPRERTATVVRMNLLDVIAAITSDVDFDTESARHTGSSRAALGVPLPALMHAYRIAFQMVWREFRSVAESDTSFSRHAVLAATERIWNGYDRFATEVANAHREHTTEQILDDAAERAALTEHLLEGRISSEASLWEVASMLRLAAPGVRPVPTRGPYLAVAAAATTVGRQPLPGVESKLRGLDLYSAWRLLPDQQIGLIHTPSAQARTAAMSLLTRLATGRVGVSAPFAELGDTAKSLKYARVSLNGPGTGVTQFDDSVLSIAAVSTPEVSVDLATSVLGRLYALTPEDRDPLVETFRAWVTADGNVTATAEELFVHRNTVRHRLRRIEELTGRSTSSPRQLAELCLAFEVDARLRVPEHGATE
ncbi:PucR family transcriptional regulator [Gordonia neofelifaecis]|uniref:Putative transcriptional regulator, PucR family protein n=1 Tax=Gordonia neofelifaecis NRRL B-59395 TaxID=644548 RepID=F1YMX9_9ACTN|nr:PucR family transcriptional regulator [Gordonia neofelifaecis]EGD54064.1 putative transcriptional regulator, PucR family protein [Gordonia neofelifaecis NRRL B-59395]